VGDRKYYAFLPELENASKLLSVLSKKDAFLLLLMIEDGLRVESARLQPYGLSKEQCQRRLRILAEHGLIKKNRGLYTYTKFGNFVSEALLKYLITCNKSLAVLNWLDKLRSTDEFTPEQIDDLLNILTEFHNTSNYSSLKFVWTYEESLSILIHMILLARKELLIATRIMHEKLVKAVLNRARAGVKIRILADHDLVKSYVRNSQVTPNNSDTHTLERMAAVANPFYPEKIPRRICEVPFGLVIVDRKNAALEILNQYQPKVMYGGLQIREENCSMMLSEFFEKLWDQAADPTPELISNLFQRSLDKGDARQYSADHD
jgi:predicted transcriptional regulator